MSKVITGGKTVFEDLLFDGMLNDKSRKFTDRGHTFSIKNSSGEFEFAVDGAIHAGLPKKINVYGPVYERRSTPLGTGLLGYIEVETGKIKAMRSGSRDKDNTKLAVDDWLRKYGISLSQLGWDVSYSEGWARIFKRKPDSIIKKEIAILAASAPGQQLDLYHHDGKRKLTYQEGQKLAIPTTIYEYVRQQAKKDHTFEDLVRSYTVVNRRVSSWEDGPGYKHFHKE